MQTINQTDISKKLKNIVSGTDQNRLIENTQSAAEKIKEATQAKFGGFGEDVGTVKSGVKGLTQITDNLADDPSVTEPGLAKLDPSIANTLNGLKTDISSSDKSNIDKMFKSTLVDAEAAYEQAAAAITTDAEMLKEVFTDGSIQAIADTVKDKTTDNVSKIGESLESLQSEEFSGDISTIVTDLSDNKVVQELTSSINGIAKRLTSAVAGITSGNFLKDLAESLTNNVQSEISSIGISNLPTNKIKSFSSRILNKDADGVKDALTNSIPLSNELQSILKIDKFENYKSISTELDKLKNSIGVTPAILTEVDEIKNIGDNIGNKIKPNLGTIGATVVNEDKNTPSNPNPVSNLSNKDASTFKILNSKEEIVKYLQAASRPITTLIVNGGYFFLDNSTYTAADDALEWQNTTVNLRADFPDFNYDNGKGHFFIRKDGTIETSRSLELYGGGLQTDLRWKLYSIEVVISAGWNCTSDKYPPGKVPSSEYNTKSWTQAQWKAFDTLLSAFYTAFPYGDAFGLGDFITTGPTSLSPGFDVESYIAKPPFNRKNTQSIYLIQEDNLVNNKAFLSPEEIASVNSQKAEKKKNELNDVQ